MRATHVVNIAQGQAFRAIKAINSKLQVGTAFSMANCEPATKSDADRAHALGNVWFVHPAFHGEYPKAFPGDNPLDLMGVKSGDMELCRAPLDFLGINYYRRQLVSAIPPTPLEITENGCSYLDCPDEHGRIPDERRIQFMRGYLHAVGRAILHSVNVRAYHHWSLLDNFEWAEGYAQRFGLTYVDFRTQKRTIKDSGHWYAKLAATGSLT
jgi:beta-glucosidase